MGSEREVRSPRWGGHRGSTRVTQGVGRGNGSSGKQMTRGQEGLFADLMAGFEVGRSPSCCFCFSCNREAAYGWHRVATECRVGGTGDIQGARDVAGDEECQVALRLAGKATGRFSHVGASPFPPPCPSLLPQAPLRSESQWPRSSGTDEWAPSSFLLLGWSEQRRWLSSWAQAGSGGARMVSSAWQLRNVAGLG